MAPGNRATVLAGIASSWMLLTVTVFIVFLKYSTAETLDVTELWMAIGLLAGGCASVGVAMLGSSRLRPVGAGLLIGLGLSGLTVIALIYSIAGSLAGHSN